MRNPTTDFLNALSPSAIVMFDVQGSSRGSFLPTGESPVIFVQPGYDFTSNPTKELFERLNELKTKYSVAMFADSKPPSEDAFKDARAFILTLPLAHIVKPSIQVAADGEVNFQWAGSDFRIDLGFYGNEKFSYYAAKTGQDTLLGDDVPVKDGIPTRLVDFATVR